jgi:hypothetical protein
MKQVQNQGEKINDFLGEFNNWQSLKDDSTLTMINPKIRQAPDELRKV